MTPEFLPTDALASAVAPDAPSTSTTQQHADALSDVLREYMHVTERLQATHDTLQHEVGRLRAELATKDAELERRRRLASLGELAAGVAHEVRNPLGAISLYSGLLRTELHDGARDSALTLLAKIEQGVRAIDGVVRDTLALAPSHGRTNPVPVSELVEDAVSVARAVFERRAVALTVPAADPHLVVDGHRDGLQRVLVNLLHNAAEASAAGTQVTLRVSEAAEEVRFAIEDEGCGLDPDVLDRIFDPFYTTKDHGTGLGLTMAHRLIEAHGGTLTAQNRADRGAVFEIRLPMNQKGRFDSSTTNQTSAA